MQVRLCDWTVCKEGLLSADLYEYLSRLDCNVTRTNDEEFISSLFGDETLTEDECHNESNMLRAPGRETAQHMRALTYYHLELALLALGPRPYARVG